MLDRSFCEFEYDFIDLILRGFDGEGAIREKLNHSYYSVSIFKNIYLKQK